MGKEVSLCVSCPEFLLVTVFQIITGLVPTVGVVQGSQQEDLESGGGRGDWVAYTVSIRTCLMLGSQLGW